MKHIITFTVFFFLLSCTGRPQWQCREGDPIKSTSYDKRCLELQKEAGNHGREIGVCYKKPENSEQTWFAKDVKRLHPDPEACKAIYDEARKKCDALGPPGPGDLVYTSGSATYRGGKPVIVNGKPVCP